ncbi:hypothetical protein D3C78_1962660 [compost metagenome]
MLWVSNQAMAMLASTATSITATIAQLVSSNSSSPCRLEASASWRTSSISAVRFCNRLS